MIPVVIQTTRKYKEEKEILPTRVQLTKATTKSKKIF